MSEIKNAKIESTMLGIEDHGIMTCFLYLDYGGSCQGFGGYGLDSYNESLKRRVGTDYGLEFIKCILDTVGVEKWEDLPGKYIKADADFDRVRGIGNIIKDKWFYPEKDLKLLLKFKESLNILNNAK